MSVFFHLFLRRAFTVVAATSHTLDFQAPSRTPPATPPARKGIFSFLLLLSPIGHCILHVMEEIIKHGHGAGLVLAQHIKKKKRKRKVVGL
jgi:hypothetical protein